MKIENLRKLFNETTGDLVVKNFKEMCDILEVEPKEGNSKKAQIKEFETIFRYEKQGQKFFVKEVYEMQLDKQDNRGAKGKFSDDLQDIMLNVLSQSPKGELLFSKNVLLKALNMINDNYKVAKYNVPKLSELIEVDESVVYEFYNTSNNKMLSYVETALNRLRSRRLVIWERVMVVAKAVAEKNILGEDKLNFYDDSDIAKVKTSLEYRQATYEEKQIILEIERDVLKDLNCKNVQICYARGLYKTYKTRVKALIQDKLNVKFHFMGYVITYNYAEIMEELNKINVDDLHTSKINVNSNILETLSTNATTKNTNSTKKKQLLAEIQDILALYSEDELKRIGIKNMNKKNEIHTNDKFVEDTVKVANVVIKQNATDIREELIKEPIEKTTTEEVDNGDIDLPF